MKSLPQGASDVVAPLASVDIIDKMLFHITLCSVLDSIIINETDVPLINSAATQVADPTHSHLCCSSVSSFASVSR